MKRRTGETFLPNLMVQISQDENKKEIHLKKQIEKVIKAEEDKI